MMAVPLAVILFAQQMPETTPAWTVAGIAGFIATTVIGGFGWFAKVYLPAKDQQTRDMIADMKEIMKSKDDRIGELIVLLSKEGEANRKSRHDAANAEMGRLGEVITNNRDEMKAMRDEHRSDAEKDRDAFMQRNQNITMELRTQTAELKLALLGACRYAPPHHSPVNGPSSPQKVGETHP